MWLMPGSDKRQTCVIFLSFSVKLWFLSLDWLESWQRLKVGQTHTAKDQVQTQDEAQVNLFDRLELQNVPRK